MTSQEAPGRALEDDAVKENIVRMGPQQGGRTRGQTGIDVQEGELGQITAQRMYRMRCECGRPWFELELKRLVQCPACRRLNLVSL
jgi:hypothetical protein